MDCFENVIDFKIHNTLRILIAGYLLEMEIFLKRSVAEVATATYEETEMMEAEK
jgi:hypothetical protein